MAKTYIYHHLGLGDHIVCNGIVRLISAQYEGSYLFCKDHNYDTVSFMYRDDPKISVFKGDDNTARQFQRRREDGYDFKNVGFTSPDSATSFEKVFYEQHGYGIDYKWSAFKYVRDTKREESLYQSLDIKEPYIFVHDDDRRRIERLPKNIRIIRAEKGITPVIFDYLKVIENAEEAHCRESCFSFMIDLTGAAKELILHRYLQDIPKFYVPEYRSRHTVLT